MRRALGGATVAHVPMAFCTPGSTLLDVVEQLSRVQVVDGGRSVAVLSDNRDLHVRHAENLLVDHTRNCPKEYFGLMQTGVDAALGLAGARRPFHGRLHEPSIEAVRASGADVVVLYEGHLAATSLPWWDALRPAVTVLLYVHNPLSRTYRSRELARMAAQCDAIVFCADHLRADAERRLSGAGIPLVTVRNGIAPAFFDGTDTATGAAGTASAEDLDGPFEILFLGRTAAHKGPQHLLAALPQAQRRSTRPLRAIVVGSDNYGLDAGLSAFELELRGLAAQAGVPVEFVAHVDRAEAVRLMRRASAVCLPSVWAEGLPLVALEAMAVGTPVLAFDAAGIVEACADAAAYAPVGDTARLAEVIAAAADDPVTLARQAARGRARAEQFTWEHTWDAFDALVAQL